MAAYKFKTLDDILRYPSPKTTAFKEIWHASQKGFGVRVMRPSKRDGSVRRTYLVRFSDEKGEDVKRNIYPVTTDRKDFENAWDIVRQRRAENEASRQTGEKPKVVTLRQAFENYLNLKKDTLSPATVEDYRGKFRYLSDVPMPTTPEQAKRAKWADSIAYLRKTAERNLSELDADFWEGAYADLRDACGKPTAVAVCRLARAIYSGPVNKRQVDRSPFIGLTEMGLFKVARKKPRFIHARNMPIFWQWMHTHPHISVRDFMLVQLFTGFRLSVVGQLRWSQVDMENRAYLVPMEERGNKSKREVYFPIPDYLFEQVFVPRHQARGTNTYVIPSPKFPGKPLHSVRGSFEAMQVKTGLTGIQSHDVRATFGTIAHATLKDVVLVGRLLTHNVETRVADALVTSGYIRTDETDFHQAMNLVAGAILTFATKPEKVKGIELVEPPTDVSALLAD